MSWKWRAYDDRKRLCLSSKTKRRHILDILFELPTLRNSLFSTWNKKRLLWTVKHRETLLSATQSAADFFQQSDSIHYFELYVIDGETYCTQKWHKFFFILVINRLTPNDPYMGRTAPLTSKLCILYICSTNIGTEYFKHALYSPFFFLFKMQFVS